jgi:hypothetical protein
MMYTLPRSLTSPIVGMEEQANFSLARRSWANDQYLAYFLKTAG